MKTFLPLLTLCVIQLIGCSTSGSGADSDTPPIHWNLQAILNETYGVTNASGSILVWMVQEDNRPLYVESFIAVFTDGDQWRLTHLWRHPRDKNPNFSRWQEFSVDDAPFVGSLKLNHKPTQSELLRFLQDTWWEFNVESDWHIHDVGLNPLGWRDMTGNAPPDDFIKEIGKHR